MTIFKGCMEARQSHLMTKIFPFHSSNSTEKINQSILANTRHFLHSSMSLWFASAGVYLRLGWSDTRSKCYQIRSSRISQQNDGDMIPIRRPSVENGAIIQGMMQRRRCQVTGHFQIELSRLKYSNCSLANSTDDGRASPASKPLPTTSKKNKSDQ